MTALLITSSANSQVRAVQTLIRKRADREAQGAFVIEGIRSLREVPAGDVRKLFLTEAFLEKCDPQDRAFLDALVCERFQVTGEVMRRLSDTVHPQGVLAVVAMHRYTPEEVLASSSEEPLILLLENLQDPGNLGTIVRTGEGAGVTGILLIGDTADLYNPKVVRATMGSLFRVPIARCRQLTELIDLLYDRGIRLYAADPAGACAYDTCDYRGGTAFLIGNEGNGLTETALAVADEKITIPMRGQVESLNAAIAAALLTFEAASQRRVSRS